ncbi:hypothetical protein QJS66_23300 (plasmid) [Kocuria rhizophila]|nr:hypothetical protein QJS66_23300 [Kocuria rhizophila]
METTTYTTNQTRSWRQCWQPTTPTPPAMTAEISAGHVDAPSGNGPGPLTLRRQDATGAVRSEFLA